MDVYKTGDEQAEAIKKWWDENGKSAIFGIILGLGAIFGWQQWQAYIISQNESASTLYQEVLTAINENNLQDARGPASAIIHNYGKTGYAILARLMLARIAVEEDEDYTTAATHLQWALDNVKDKAMKHEIRSRLARVYMATDRLDDALSLVNIDSTGAYGPLYDEIRGDIYTLMENHTEARLAYQQAIANSRPSSTDAILLNIKLNSLGK